MMRANGLHERIDLAERRILVTGASGFLGQHLCRRLADRGADVHGLSRTARSGGAPLTWWQGDMADPACARAMMRRLKPYAVVHLAGCVSASACLDMIAPTLRSLLVSSVNVLTAAAERGDCRVVLTGSLTEPEAAEAAPSSGYAAAKWASNAYGRMFYSVYNVPVAIVRPFMTYGPGQNPLKVIPSTILSLLTGEAPRLSSGRWQADWIYVDDVVDGMVAALESRDSPGRAFDLGTGHVASVRAVVERVVELMGADIEPRFSTLPERPNERIRAADPEPAKALLGWAPKVTLTDGLARTIDWYTRQRCATARRAFGESS